MKIKHVIIGDPTDVNIGEKINFGFFEDYDYAALYPNKVYYVLPKLHIKYHKRVKNRNKLYNKLKKLGRRM
jgi:hypothetical protein